MVLQAELTISEALASIVYYAFLFAGSITIGYLFLRLTRPEVRTLPKKLKTRNAFLAGAGFLAIAIAVDLALNGVENVARVNSFTPLIASLLAGFTFVIFNLATSLKTRPLVIGVRVPRGRERVLRGLAYVEEVVIKPAGATAPFLERELEAGKPSSTGIPRVEKSVHEKLEELKRAGAIRIEKPVVEKPVFEKPAVEKPLAAPTPQGAAQQAAKPTPAPTPSVKKPGFFARLFGKKPKATAAAAAAAGPAREEAEIEVIVKELGLVEERPARAKGAPAGTSAPPGGERHRLYLHAKEAGGAQGGKVSEVEKEREEVGEFVKDVYTQLKADQKPGRFEGESRRAPAAEGSREGTAGTRAGS